MLLFGVSRKSKLPFGFCKLVTDKQSRTVCVTVGRLQVAGGDVAELGPGGDEVEVDVGSGQVVDRSTQ